MKAGRELDALIAEKIMGWQGRKTIYRWSDRKKKTNPLIAFTEGVDGMGDYSTFVDDEGLKIQFGAPHRVFFAPNYSTDIADALQVVEKLSESKIYLSIHKLMTCWQVSWSADLDDEAEAETAPHAVCLAALKVGGWDGEEK